MTFSIVMGILVLGGLAIYLIYQSRGNLNLRPSLSKTTSQSSSQAKAALFDPDIVKNKWAEIGAMQTSGPSGLKNALIEADKLLDYVMIAKGFTGETMGDRLKSGGAAFSNLNAVWAAHKLRNQLAHEVEHDLVPDQVRRAITDLGQAIRDLEVNL